jgi:hypothetical protein
VRRDKIDDDDVCIGLVIEKASAVDIVASRKRKHERVLNIVEVAV